MWCLFLLTLNTRGTVCATAEMSGRGASPARETVLSCEKEPTKQTHLYELLENYRPESARPALYM